MKIMKALGALLAAGGLVFVMAGTAGAVSEPNVPSTSTSSSGTDLNQSFVGQDLSGLSNLCDNFTASDNGIWVQFNLTSAASDTGNLSATFSNPSFTVTDQPVDKADGGTDKWYVFVTGGTSATVVESAHTDISGNNLVISHVCFSESSSSSSSSTTESTTSSTTESTTSSTTESTTSSASSSSSSASSTSSTTSSGGGGGGGGGGSSTTSLPATLAFGEGSNPTDHTWMLIAALGMLLGSALVLAPARTKGRR